MENIRDGHRKRTPDVKDETGGKRDYYWYLARSWIVLPGIGRVPRFRKICLQVLEHDDQWIRANQGRIDEVLDSDEVRLFLVRRRDLSPGALWEATKAANPRLRREAKAALDEFYASIEGARHRALMECFTDPSAHRLAVGLMPVKSDLNCQPAVVRSPREIDALFNLSHLGRYSELDRLLDRRLAEVKRWWKDKLAVPSHRKVPLSTRFTYLFADNLREQGRPWTEIAREVASEQYKADPKHTVDRVKKGVGALRRRTLGSKSSQRVQTSPRKSGRPAS